MVPGVFLVLCNICAHVFAFVTDRSSFLEPTDNHVVAHAFLVSFSVGKQAKQVFCAATWPPEDQPPEDQTPRELGHPGAQWSGCAGLAGLGEAAASFSKSL